MDWCGYVFYLCISAIYRPPGGRFSEPGPRLGRWRAGALWEARRGYQIGKGRGGGKRAGLSTDGGRVLPHIPSASSWTWGVPENRAGGSLESVQEIIWNLFPAFQNFKFLFSLF